MAYAHSKWFKITLKNPSNFSNKSIKPNFLNLFNAPFHPILIDIKKIDTLALKKGKTENNTFVQAVSKRK